MSQQLPLQELTGLGPIPFEPGQLIHGRYEILHVIGSGGVGFVVAARHAGFDDLVALKFLRPEFTSNAEAVARFTIEARASFKLRSEHVVRVLDVDICEGTPFIAMELLEGTDVRRVLDRCRVLDLEPAVDYMLQACEALSAAHALGVIHRDIKPENLFLLGEGADDDHLKVLDFGISKVALVSNLRATNQALTRVAVGTPPYMSPEQVRAARDLDARSDLWSVGCVLYELVTGMAPFERESLMQSCAAVLEEEPLPPRQLRPAVPSGLSDAIMRCLRKSPAERFADVAELAEAMGPFGSGRFAAYPARCRAILNGEGPGRRSTPTAIAAVSTRSTGSVATSTAGAGRAVSVRMHSQLAAAAQSTALAERAVTITSHTRAQTGSMAALRRTGEQAPALARSTHAGLAGDGSARVQVVANSRFRAQPAANAPAEAEDPLELAMRSGVGKRKTGAIIAWSTSLVLVAGLTAYMTTHERSVHLAPQVLPRAPETAQATAGTTELMPARRPAPEPPPPVQLTATEEAPAPAPREPAAPAAAEAELPDGIDKAAQNAKATPKGRTRLTAVARRLADATNADPDVGF